MAWGTITTAGNYGLYFYKYDHWPSFAAMPWHISSAQKPCSISVARGGISNNEKPSKRTEFALDLMQYPAKMVAIER